MPATNMYLMKTSNEIKHVHLKHSHGDTLNFLTLVWLTLSIIDPYVFFHDHWMATREGVT